jgi:mRNA interferase HigB
MFNIINRRAILEYCKIYPAAKLALLVWYQKLSKSGFLNFNELKKTFPDASLVGDDRVIFNIMGNRFRLIVRIVFVYKVIQVKWFGTHNEYDRIDALTINKQL